MAKKFSPPYGDSTYDSEKVTNVLTFSPPYGDGTESGKPTAYKKMFSPPYGDSTLRLPDQGLLQGVFAPLRGWY